jgi:hypothetical protein
MNMINNPSFEMGHCCYQSPFSTFHMVHKDNNFTSRLGDFSGRLQISTSGYISTTPTASIVSQDISSEDLQDYWDDAAYCSEESDELIGKTLVVSASSRMEIVYFHPGTSWRLELHVLFENASSASKADWIEKVEFDGSNPNWQTRVLTVSMNKDAVVKRVKLVGALQAYRGVVYWDDWTAVWNSVCSAAPTQQPLEMGERA